MTYKCQHSIKKLSQSLRNTGHLWHMADPWGCDGKTCLSSFLHFPFFLPLNKSSFVGSYLKLYFSLSKFWENDENKSSYFLGGLEFGDSFMKHLRFKKAKEACPAAIRPHQNTDTVFTKRLLSPRALHWAVSFGFEHSCSSISQEHLAFARRAIN